MQTRRSWLGLAKRWTPTGSQQEVEDPYPVLVVGEDDSDESILWAGSGSSGAVVTCALAALVDIFVLGLRMSGTAAPVSVLVDVTPAAPTLAGAVAFLRAPPAAIPNAFFHTTNVIPAGSNLFQGVGAGVTWQMLPGKGLLLPAGFSIFCSTGAVANTLGALWRAG